MWVEPLNSVRFPLHEQLIYPFIKQETLHPHCCEKKNKKQKQLSYFVALLTIALIRFYLGKPIMLQLMDSLLFCDTARFHFVNF